MVNLFGRQDTTKIMIHCRHCQTSGGSEHFTTQSSKELLLICTRVRWRRLGTSISHVVTPKPYRIRRNWCHSSGLTHQRLSNSSPNYTVGLIKYIT
ncbi:hypothetical protein Y1Q_0000489 [Alligator mississippiensis]|uniref:Uncharacterized protein n=1 Tax=Alligator mississippiensis TaxID=8496 RepID=A0A151MBL5_ALLMI|nr:hypothetical protein Y1Q_0000489 [Alligator mississippiensis]